MSFSQQTINSCPLTFLQPRCYILCSYLTFPEYSLFFSYLSQSKKNSLYLGGKPNQNPHGKSQHSAWQRSTLFTVTDLSQILFGSFTRERKAFGNLDVSRCLSRVDGQKVGLFLCEGLPTGTILVTFHHHKKTQQSVLCGSVLSRLSPRKYTRRRKRRIVQSNIDLVETQSLRSALRAKYL